MPKAPPTLIEDKGRPALKREADGAILRFAQQQVKGLGPRLKNVTADVLDTYLHRGTISREQHDAGDHLRRLHYTAHGSGYASVNYAGVHGVADHSQNWRYTARQAHAMSLLSDLLGALPREQRYVVERVVIWGETANRPARAIGISERRGIELLRHGLNTVRETIAGGGRPDASSGSGT